MKRLAAMGAYRLSLYLKVNGEPDYWKNYPRLLCEEVSENDIEIFEENCLYSISEEDSPLKKLMDMVKPTDEEGHLAWVCIELAMLYYMEKQAGEIFNHIYGETKVGATLGVAAKIVYGDKEFLDKFLIIRKAFERVELLFLAKYPADKIMDTLLIVDDRLIDWLSGGEHLDLLQSRFVSLYKPDIKYSGNIIWDKKVNYISEALNRFRILPRDNVPVVAVSGDEQSGRRYIVKRVADRCDLTILFADIIYLGDIHHILGKWRSLLREVMLNSVAICVTGINFNKETQAYLRIMTEEYLFFLSRINNIPLFFTLDKKVKLTPFIKVPVINCELPIPNLRQRKIAWDTFIGTYFKENKFNTKELAVKMKLSIGKIKKIVKRISYEQEEDYYNSHMVFKYCYELLDDGRYDSIKRIESIYSLDDLKLEQSQKNIIKDICNQIEYRQKVLEDWNVRSRYAYGMGVSALFSGPPGTGKTMAVHVIAGILGLELFKVDLSQIVDKYIGETEKRLEEVFNKAEQSNMILFFDEADSILGKRSEVKDSKDKYANTEVSYLLQKIEEYDGIVILATNYSQNIDSAIMRRIRFTVHFPLPDEETRKEIWKSSFSKEVPQENIDYEYLARQFEFSGGQIKNVVLNAIFFAAADEEAVQMKHLIKAVKRELTKDKKISFQEALGEYAHFTEK